jgi:hypothetical protein
MFLYFSVCKNPVLEVSVEIVDFRPTQFPISHKISNHRYVDLQIEKKKRDQNRMLFTVKDSISIKQRKRG